MRITRITLKIVLVSLLELLTAEIAFSNGCSNVRRETICYSVGNYTKRTWNDAQRECQNKNSSLPIIRNIEEQKAIEAYLGHLNSKALRINAVWMSGKKITYKDWAWISNGQTLDAAITISNYNSAWKTHMVIQWPTTETENMLKPEHPMNNAWYLCQYKDRQCNGQQHEFNATNGCLIPSEYGNTSWYEARNHCLAKRGDLAVLTDQDLQNLKNHEFPNDNYWIGLRIVNWVWKTNSQALPEEEEVKYTKWVKLTMSTKEDLCIYIEANDSKWRASHCNHEVFSVICEKRAPTTTDSTSGNSTTATTDGNSHTTTATIAATTNNHNDESSTTAYAAIGAGAVIIILCIVVILIVIWRKSKSSNNKTEPAKMDSKNTNGSKDKKTNENKSSKTTEEQSIYADIPLAEKTANDMVEATQKGTVYASLDFNQGVTYAEPSKLYANTQNVSGPIYAEALNATENGATSAGSSPAVKIGPMGDVYTLPTTNVTPSSAKTMERLIYANT